MPMTRTTNRTYRELCKLKSFDERYEYLRLSNSVGAVTFGFDRYLNQALYTSREWIHIRDSVIVRDNGCDLAMPGYEIFGKILVHHMNPISIEDIEKRSDIVFDPEFLICTTHRTHLAIHYGSADLLPKIPVERTPGDTAPWLSKKLKKT